MKSDRDKGTIAALLSKYTDVFSTGDSDSRQTNLVEHSIPVVVRYKTNKTSPQKAWPRKGKRGRETSE